MPDFVIRNRFLALMRSCICVPLLLFWRLGGITEKRLDLYGHDLVFFGSFPQVSNVVNSFSGYYSRGGVPGEMSLFLFADLSMSPLGRWGVLLRSLFGLFVTVIRR